MNKSAQTDPREVNAFAERVLGPLEQITDHTRQSGQVIEVRDRDGTHWIVKTTAGDAHFRRERFAY